MDKRRRHMIKIIFFLKKISASINTRVRFFLTFLYILSSLALDVDLRNKFKKYLERKLIYVQKYKFLQEKKNQLKLLLYKNKTSHEILYENAFSYYWKNYSNDLTKLRNERLDRYLKQKYLRPFTNKKELNKNTKKFLY